jgi:hypothetical protein
MIHATSRDRWEIGVAGWIIQDGNYEDFAVDDRCAFAVEAFARGFSMHHGTAMPRASGVEGQRALYDVVGRVTYHRERAWILDIGILVYGNQDDLPDGVSGGDLVAGRVYLSISGPGVYPESFVIPDEAVYAWVIEAIERETTPWLREGRSYRRDPNNISFTSVARTNAWEDDDGYPHYVLHSKLS